MAALQAFANAYGKLDAGEVVKVAPFLASSAQRIAADFKQFRSYSITMSIVQISFSPDGTSATVRCKITREIETFARGTQRPPAQGADMRLQRTSGRWVIAGIDYLGSDR
jgi:hypothetical protein